MPWSRNAALIVAFLVAASSTLLLAMRVDAPSVIPDDLDPVERQLVEFLLLLPVAALVCCVVRNVIGLHTFGTFAPALLGLAFREVHSPVGVFVLLTVLSIGWVLRRGVAQLNLLQVPRSAVMLSLVVGLLVAFILIAHALGRPMGQALPFLPLVIVTGLVERFWTTEEEDGTPAAVRTMIATLVTSVAVFLVVRMPAIASTVMKHPEVLGLVIAGQLVIGRYTGYRLVELYRFRNLADLPEKRG